VFYNQMYSLTLSVYNLFNVLHLILFLMLVLIDSSLVYLLAVFTGVQLSEFQTRSAVRTCGLSFSGNLVMYTTDKAMSQPCEMLVYDLRDEGQMSKLAYPTSTELIFCTWLF